MLKYDQSYAAGDFATRLRQRSDVTEKLVIAFGGLISTIDKEPDFREGTKSLMESDLLSCPHSNFEELDPIRLAITMTRSSHLTMQWNSS